MPEPVGADNRTLTASLRSGHNGRRLSANDRRPYRFPRGGRFWRFIVAKKADQPRGDRHRSQSPSGAECGGGLHTSSIGPAGGAARA